MEFLSHHTCDSLGDTVVSTEIFLSSNALVWEMTVGRTFFPILPLTWKKKKVIFHVAHITF
jgi:hypothetical protein